MDNSKKIIVDENNWPTPFRETPRVTVGYAGKKINMTNSKSLRKISIKRRGEIAEEMLMSLGAGLMTIWGAKEGFKTYKELKEKLKKN